MGTKVPPPLDESNEGQPTSKESTVDNSSDWTPTEYVYFVPRMWQAIT